MKLSMSNHFASNDRAREVKENGHTIKVIKCCFAAINTEIDCLYGYGFYGFKDYLYDFERPDIVVSISQQDIDEEKSKHPELLEPEIHIEDSRVTATYDYGFLEPLVAYNKMADAVIQFDTLLFHSSVVAKDNHAYAFVAPSGVGKSTRTRIWLDVIPDSFVVNGDKPFLKFTDDKVLACGSPWCGKEGWNTNVMVPLHAIFFVERAKEETIIEEISMGKAFPYLMQQTHQSLSPKLQFKTILLLKKLEGKVRFFKFCSAPTPEAIRIAYETARPD